MLENTVTRGGGGPRRRRDDHARADHLRRRLRRAQRAPYGILKGVVDGNAFVKGTWGAAIVDELAPADGDIVIEGKRGLDTFASTNLDFILRSKGIKTSCSADSSPTAASSRRCAPRTRTGTG